MFNSITEGFSNLLDSIGGIFKWLGSFFVELGKALTSGFQWFYDTLLKPFFDGVVDFFKLIGDFLKGLWDFFVNLFKALFVPSDDYFKTKVDSVTSNVSSKVGVDISTLESLKGVASRNTRSAVQFVYNFKLFGYNLHIDVDFLKKAQPYSQALFMGLASIFLCWYNYKNVVRLFGKNTIEGSNAFQSQGGKKE